MKHSILLPFILIFGCISEVLSGEIIKVCPTCKWKDAQEAIDKACIGDTIHIAKGFYPVTRLNIQRQLTIIGEEGAVLDAGNNGTIITINADSVTLANLTLQNSGQSHIEERAGIRINRSRHAKLINNTILRANFGIYIAYVSHATIDNNIIKGEAKQEANSGNGIHMWYCKNLSISNNTITRHRDGIYLEFTDSSEIHHNKTMNNLRYGLHFMFSNNDKYSYNEFRNNGAGVAVMFSRKIDMSHNKFASNWGKASYGLLLKEIYDLNVLHNEFKENTIGIYIEGSNRVLYQYNTFESNGYAIKMAGGCLDNSITGNNFLSNSFDLGMHSGTASNSFDGNYWSAYEGYDLDRNHVGDIPYHPVKLFNYIVQETPEAMILLRSLFIDLLNFAEKVSPVFTPKHVADHRPEMRPIIFPKQQLTTVR